MMLAEDLRFMTIRKLQAVRVKDGWRVYQIEPGPRRLVTTGFGTTRGEAMAYAFGVVCGSRLRRKRKAA
jgi:hypothetical protein